MGLWTVKGQRCLGGGEGVPGEGKGRPLTVWAMGLDSIALSFRNSMCRPGRGRVTQ